MKRDPKDQLLYEAIVEQFGMKWMISFEDKVSNDIYIYTTEVKTWKVGVISNIWVSAKLVLFALSLTSDST